MKVISTTSDDEEGLREFVEFPYELRRNDAGWIPPLRATEYARWESHGAFLSRVDAAVFLAQEEGDTRARCAAMIDRSQPGERGMIGFFESVDDFEAAALVLDAAGRWLAGHGKTVAYGPMNGSTWHAYRFVTDGFGPPPFLLEPYNPRYYPDLWKRCGWSEAGRYYSARVRRSAWGTERGRRYLTEYERAGYGFRQARIHRWQDEARLLFASSKEIFALNKLYSDITFPEFWQLYRDAPLLIKKWNLQFAVDPRGNEIGFILTVPDFAEPMRTLGPSPSLRARLRFRFARSTPRRVIFKSFGVLPRLRKVRVGAALIERIESILTVSPFEEAIHALMSSDNLSRSYSTGRGEPFREYSLFAKDLS